jgi:hypothetical protein
MAIRKRIHGLRKIINYILFTDNAIVMTSVKQDRDFKENVIHGNIPDGILGDAVNWVAKNMNPEDVFSEKDLSTWAEENGYILEKDAGSR